MREIRTSGLTSGDGKRSVAAWPKPPRPSSTLQVKGRKRHALVDTDGRALLLHAHPADIQDRDAAGPLLSVSRRFWPFVQTAFADSAYDAKRVAAATDIMLEIVRKHPDQVGFVVQPRRWEVERFFAWINRNRRLAKDVEATIRQPSPSSTPPPSCSSPAASHAPHEFQNRLLARSLPNGFGIAHAVRLVYRLGLTARRPLLHNCFRSAHALFLDHGCIL